MFKTQLAQKLASCQLVMFLIEGIALACGKGLPLKVVFWPLELLVFIAIVFWGIFGAIVAAVSKK